MNKECIDKTGPIYCCICPLSKRQSVTWLASPLTDGLVYLYTGQFYHTKLYLLQVSSSTTQGSVVELALVWLMVASSQWLATH